MATDDQYSMGMKFGVTGKRDPREMQMITGFNLLAIIQSGEGGGGGQGQSSGGLGE